MSSASNIPVITEGEAQATLANLARAWASPETFAFLPNRGSEVLEWMERRLSLLPEAYRRDHFVLLTSGSTGTPKCVVGLKARAEGLARVLHSAQDGEEVRECVLALPLSYSYAFVNQWLWSSVHGRRLVATEGFSQPDRLGAALREARCAMLCLVGAHVGLLEMYFSGETFPGVIRLHFAGGRFPQERLGLLARLFPNAVVFNNYGCAEAMPRLTLRRAADGEAAHHIGWPISGVELKADEAGRLQFRSAHGAVAVVDDGGFRAVGSEEWMFTGDLGQLAEDGHWELLGRQGEVFKRYGEKISLLQVLGVIREGWAGMADCYRETDRKGEDGYVLVLSPAATAEDARRLLRALSGRFPRPHWPLRVEGLPQWPLLSNGKTDRDALARHADAKVLWNQIY